MIEIFVYFLDLKFFALLNFQKQIYFFIPEKNHNYILLIYRGDCGVNSQIFLVSYFFHENQSIINQVFLMSFLMKYFFSYILQSIKQIFINLKSEKSFLILIDIFHILIFTLNLFYFFVTQKMEHHNSTNSHFILGNTQDRVATIYQKDYTQKKAGKQSLVKTIDPFQGSNIGPVKTQQNHYVTTNRAKMLDWKNTEKAELDQKKRNDLKTHHFVLGNYNNKISQATTNQYYHNEKSISNEAGKNSQDQKNRMRAHNHDFKESSHVLMTSAYNQQYNKKDIQLPESPNKNGQFLQNHIILGKQFTPYETTNAKQYSKKEYKPVSAIKNQVANLILGQAKSSFQTSNQIYHNQQQIIKTQLPVQTMKDLKVSHFNLGTMSPLYGTQSNNYQAYKIESNKFNKQKTQTNTNSIMMDDKFYGITTNHRQLPPRQLQINNGIKPTANKNNFHLGYQGNTYLSEFKNQYNPKNGSQIANFKKAQSNLSLGNDKNNFITQNRSSYTNKEINKPNSQNIKDINPRGHHFVVGNSHQNMITVYQDEYREQQEKKSKLFHKTNL